MAHGITERDGVFSVRSAGWHGLADNLPDYPTRAQAQAIAHGWEPVAEPIFRRVPIIGDDGDLTVEYQEVAGHVLNARSDDGFPLGVVADSYVNVLNSDMYDIAEAIEGGDPAAVRYETGGSLHGGRKVWLLMRLAEPLVIAGDPRGDTIPYFALQNDHGGKGAFRGQSLFTRIICDNTAQAADLEAQGRGTEFAFRHTMNVADRIKQAQEALAGWRHSVQAYRLLSEHLVTVPVSKEQRTEFLHAFIPDAPPHMVSDRVINNIENARDQWLTALLSETCAGIENSAFGLLQASIEYNAHYRRANTAETRFRRNYLDRSTITADALTIIREVAAV